MSHSPGKRWARSAVALVVILSFAASSVGLASSEHAENGWLGGQPAIDRLGDRLAETADLYDMTAAGLRHILNTDPYARLDQDGYLLYVEPVDDEPGGDTIESDPVFPMSDTFLLNSKPGSQRTIFLDFDGHTLNNTAWNNSTTVPQGYTALPYDSDGSPGTFSTAERAFIQAVWARVAEDFAPFDVNVTTQDPGFDAINRANAQDEVYGTRLVVSNSPASYFCSGGCGGVAYLNAFNNSFNHAYYQPAWCFSSASSSAKNIAECASHEIGHNLGLHHDGITDGATYYSGHTPWAPIMGVGYNQPVSQWSKGEYANANNQQDDIAVMGTRGAVLRTDDHGNTTGSATTFTSSAQGIISSENDVDFFRYVVGATGTATFSATPAPLGPNLDILLTLYSADGLTLTQSNPTVTRVNSSTANGLNATIQHPVAAGQTYYLRVIGTGHLNGVSGYTKYGSIGQYSVTGSVSPSNSPVDSVGLFNPLTGQWYLRDAATGKTTSFYFGNPGDMAIMGDWDGDGISTPGVYRRSTGQVFLRYTNTGGTADRTFYFGAPGDYPIVGNFNGTGGDTVSVYRPSTGQVFIINTLPPNGGAAVAEISYYFGNPGDKPFVGDWNSDGIDTVGLHRESTGYVYLRNVHTTGNAQVDFFYGNPGDYIVAGRWLAGASSDTVGIFRPSQGWFYLRYANSTGNADREFPYGNSSLRPVAGSFGTLPGSSNPPPGN